MNFVYNNNIVINYYSAYFSLCEKLPEILDQLTKRKKIGELIIKYKNIYYIKNEIN